MDNSLLYNQQSEEIERLAEAILSRLPRDKERPFYPCRYFEKKLRDALRTERLFSRCCAIRPVEDRLLAAELGIALERAELTWRQRAVIRGLANGDSPTMLAERLALSRQAVSHAFRSALKRILRAWRASPYRGLQQVYWSEVRRGKR